MATIIIKIYNLYSALLSSENVFTKMVSQTS